MRILATLFPPQIRLEKLTANFLDPGTAQLGRAFALIGDTLSHDTLNDIELLFLRAVHKGHWAVHLGDLQPLLSFRAVQSVKFCCSDCFRFELQDDAIMAMASAWPLLRCLKIRVDGTEFTLKGLVALSEKCAQLESLDLNVDFREENSKFDEMEVVSFPQKLRFCVWDSPVDNANHAINLFRRSIQGLAGPDHRASYEHSVGCVQQIIFG